MITEVSRDNALPDRDSKIEISPIHFVNKKNVIENYPNNSEEIYLGLGCFGVLKDYFGIFQMSTLLQ